MQLTTTQQTVIAILAIFLTFIFLLFLFCLYSSRRARKQTVDAQKAVLGRWKESSGGSSGEITIPNLSVPSMHSTQRQDYDLATLPGSTRGEKRGSGLAGIGTFSASPSLSRPRTHPAPSPNPDVGKPFPQLPPNGELGQPRRNPIPTLSRPMSWSRGISRTRSRSKSNVSDRSIFKPNKSRYFQNYMNPPGPPPPLPRKSSARSANSSSTGSYGRGDRRGLIEKAR
ncbi:hypothetical protein I302_107100 [Kwoniella bestiolae CBS 10118]|uniref:Uncharacterized protein n=1 Tax=Kwoniella bestiolae CBS 10118 TaxID=1296100 RepID=A0A1B9FZH9_9TREE|nr:hypothetical protein I302_05635 [Kwoniella bestiolae CBS 10118]OCF24176.1 hypothetical protein I302_05635 [Kwoniella bestiolae CBS 10118]